MSCPPCLLERGGPGAWVQPAWLRSWKPLISSGPHWLHCFAANLGLLLTSPGISDEFLNCQVHFSICSNILFIKMTDAADGGVELVLSTDRRHGDRNRICLSPSSSAPRSRVGFWPKNFPEMENDECRKLICRWPIRKIDPYILSHCMTTAIMTNCCISCSGSTQTRKKVGRMMLTSSRPWRKLSQEIQSLSKLSQECSVFN